MAIVLPHFAPQKVKLHNRTLTGIRPSSEPANKFLSKVLDVIQNRPRHFELHKGYTRPRYWWKWREHRLPTLWGLYRCLIENCRNCQWKEGFKLGEGSSEGTRRFVLEGWIKSQFRIHRTVRDVSSAQELLRKGYILLDRLIKAQSGKESEDRTYIKRFNYRLIETDRQRRWSEVYIRDLRERPPPRPIMTGRFLRPSIYNGPLPRLANQPLHISMMIASRRKAHERRVKQQKALNEQLQMIRTEHIFEKNLGHGIGPTSKEQAQEVGLIYHRLKEISRTFALGREREQRVYSQKLMDEIKSARRRRPVVMNEKKVRKRIEKRNLEIEMVSKTTE
ncbi:hypothetical protein BY996DRAFT_4574163 [Phakopsora pachyrhizi]|uniref:Uncharacterized protein n=1 Tax=Phakopsora pachyrhizi TaxID=170000 RepID=A0AAV0AIE9_PHAPC|nr:hypothetical protein BY996DRAFT_4574163 [Phakopsora pachyrhizi]CAH7668000.1 hypothetical protein PPACK8108_LOCUS2457 [Phakopsora pachyrhizi]